jgi:mannobiose 2-epimerase
MIRLPFAVLLLASFNLFSQENNDTEIRKKIAGEMEHSIQQMLGKWYPQAIDKEYGGYLSTFTYDFKPTGAQDKMIVTQARHTWSTAKAGMFYPQKEGQYKIASQHGYAFLRDAMWDKTYGGFYQLVNRKGEVKGEPMKTAYGNSFGIYALAAYYQLSKDAGALELAKKAFLWLEKNSHDPVHKGYFQHLQRDGTPVKRPANTPSTSDLGYKDQNSSIHLLEAFTELYTVWPDSLLKERLEEMLVLVRDTITTPKGYLTLFLQPDWTPVSFRDSSEASVKKHFNLDHVSFGHDVETAYLMLEASHVLGNKKDEATMAVAKRMVDHSLQNGWDKTVGGFYDGGYYFNNAPGIAIVKDTKNWWTQAEALNTLLLMADLFPNDSMHYFQKFQQLWSYAQKYLIDHEHGDWFEGGLDKEPSRKTALKGQIWKGNYHQLRSLTNCIQRLQNSGTH